MAGRKPTDSFESAIDRLYRLPLTEFTPARDVLAKKLKTGGDAEGARRIKSLPKPVLSAWVVNQLWWGSRKPFERLLDAGERLREIQARGAGSVEELRAGDERRRKALAGLIERAEKLLRESGPSVTRGVMRRVETDLETIATLAGAGDDQQLGRLSKDLESPGFDMLLALAAGKPPGRRRSTATGRTAGVAQDDAAQRAHRREIERAQRALARAEQQRSRRRSEADEAQALQTKARDRAAEVRQQITLARSRLRLAEEHAKRAATELKRADTKRQRADEALTHTEELVQRAEARLKTSRRPGGRR